MTFVPRPPKGGTQSSQHAYIPPSMQQAMTQHMKNSVPAYLKQYVGTGAYVPQHAQQALAQHMQKTMPSHMQQYAGAYLNQTVQSGAIRPALPNSVPGNAPGPLPDKLKLDHSGSVHAAQYEAKFYNNLFAADQSTPPPQNPQVLQPVQPGTVLAPAGPSQPLYPPGATPPPEQSNYDFIMNPAAPERPGLFGGNNGMLKRVLAVVLGLLLLVILFSVIKGALSGSSNLPALVSVAQDQQAMLHILDNASNQSGLDVTNQNFVATAQLGITSNQAELTTYLAKNGQKVNKKQLNLKISSSTDSELSQAATTSNYDSAFHQVMQQQLTQYQNDLRAAYAHTKGPKGRALLSRDFNQANLLLTQLDGTPDGGPAGS